MSDIGKYGNLALMSLLSVLHEDRVKTLLPQQINKLTSCYYAVCCKPVLMGDRTNLFPTCQRNKT